LKYHFSPANNLPSFMKTQKGSTLVVVVLVTVALGIVVAAIASAIGTQRRLAIHRELALIANNTAETALDYAYSYVLRDIRKKTLASSTYVPSTGHTSFTFPSGAASFLTAPPTSPSDFPGKLSNVTLSNLAVSVLPKVNKGRYFIDGTAPANANDPNRNQWVNEDEIPLVARVTATWNNETYTAYIQKSISLRRVSLFQHAIFYQGQLMLHRGYPHLGPIHSNSNLGINAHSDDTANYTGKVSSAKRFYRGSTFDDGGSGDGPYAYNPILSDGTFDLSKVTMKTDGATKIKIYDGKNMVTLDSDNSKPFDSRMATWATAAMTKFNGNLVDQSYNVPVITPTGSAGYEQDDPSTTTDEFNNGPYTLIQPLLPKTNAYRPTDNSNNLEANASLVLRIEANAAKVSPGGSVPWPITTGTMADYFVVKAYKNPSSNWSNSGADPSLLIPVALPAEVIGAAADGLVNSADTNTLSTVFPTGTTNRLTTSGSGGSGVFEPYKYDTATSTVLTGLHDPRLGRGVNVLTLDVGKLKAIMEADPSTFKTSGAGKIAKAFRDTFAIKNAATPGVTTSDWNGVVYVEFPTSLTVASGTAMSDKPKYADGTVVTDSATNGINSYKFSYGTPELRHPDRYGNTDETVRGNRTDNIIPIAPELRGYPSTFTDTELQKSDWTIPALQIINAKSLPNTPEKAGFTVATNAPLYLVGSYNSDGNLATGTNILSTTPTDYAQADTGEIPAALFCDSLTVLSDNWKDNRPKSFPGGSNASNNRMVTTSGVEISACIAAGEYPIFEFMLHALEKWSNFYNPSSADATKKSPIVIKGSVIGMFHSEIQHIKQAYSRDKTKDIQVYYTGHGAFAIPAVRFHQFLVDGNFPPGTPTADIFTQRDFRLLRVSNSDDKSIITKAGL
jgi:hypothetical protein